MADGFPDLSFNGCIFFNILENSLVKLRRVHQEIETTLACLNEEIKKAKGMVEAGEQEKAALIIQDFKKD